MTDYKLHNDIKQLSGYIYYNGKNQKPDGWLPLEKVNKLRLQRAVQLYR